MQYWTHSLLGLFILIATSFVAPLTIPTASAEQAPANVGTNERTKQLAGLYEALLKTRDPSQANGIQRDIWAVWLHHGDTRVDKLMSQVMTARRESNLDKAITLTNQIIELAPNYAEGWNQRATLHFMQESYEASLHDVAETLRLEPNHFGALSGRAIIRVRQGKSALAIQNILEALKVNPHLQERRLLKMLGYEERTT